MSGGLSPASIRSSEKRSSNLDGLDDRQPPATHRRQHLVRAQVDRSRVPRQIGVLHFAIPSEVLPGQVDLEINRVARVSRGTARNSLTGDSKSGKAHPSDFLNELGPGSQDFSNQARSARCQSPIHGDVLEDQGIPLNYHLCQEVDRSLNRQKCPFKQVAGLQMD